MSESTMSGSLLNIIVDGHPITELPSDLYIPIDALRVFLERFEGPLDLLLYLSKKQQIDIIDIPMSEITQQYLRFINVMHVMNILVAAEYLAMAALLVEIKSRLLLPVLRVAEEESDLDPRIELALRLQEYARYKQAAYDLDQLSIVNRDTYIAKADLIIATKASPSFQVPWLMDAMQQVSCRLGRQEGYVIIQEALSIRERMSAILAIIRPGTSMRFGDFLIGKEGRLGVVVTLIALLELVRQSMVICMQDKPLDPIYVNILTPMVDPNSWTENSSE